MERLQTFGSCRAIDGKAGTVEVVASTGDVARDDAIILPSGWDLTDFRLNPVMLWSHDIYSLPVARAIDLQVTEEALLATAEFDMDDPDSARIFGKIERGYVNATSVRWNPIETRVDMIDGHEVIVFVRASLLEISFVAVPADPKALIKRCDGEALNIEDYRPADNSKTETDERDAARLAAVTGTLADYVEARAGRPTVAQLLVTKIAQVKE